MVLGHELWTERFGADPGRVGRSVSLDGEPYTVVGVMPPGFYFPFEGVQLWTPLTPSHFENRAYPVLRSVGRLAPGVELGEAEDAMAAVARRMAEDNADLEGIGIRVVTRLEEEVGSVRPGLLLLTGSVAVVLLLACVNLANLLVARTQRQSLSEMLFTDGEVLGRHLEVGTGSASTRMEVVGVVADARMTDVRREAEPHFYRSMTQRAGRSRTVLLRASGDPRSVLAAIRPAVAQIDPGIIVEEVGTLEGSISRTLAPDRLRTWLIGAMAALALTLALVGIFGVVAQAVEQQTREIGIRMALGSRTRAEVGRVVVRVVVPVLFGAVLGTLAAWQGSGLMEAFVEDRFLQDPASYVLAPLVLLVAAGIAAWLPARRAAGIDPAKVLASE